MVTVFDDREVFRRFEGNPILAPTDWPHMVNAAFNPGATTLDGETVLLVRVEDRTGRSHFCLARSEDGYTGWRIDREHQLLADYGSYEERWGIEDPRITTIGEDHYVVYTGFSEGGPLVCLARTRDFGDYERLGVLMPPEDKDAALFPRQFDGRWALIHRPVPNQASRGVHIWLSWSPDLRNWGDHTVVVRAREGGWWDAAKVGLGPPPLETSEGWLLAYHGVRVTASGSIYRVGLALTALEDPGRLLARSEEWVFGPQAPYERSGDVRDVVFPTGWVLGDDGDTLRVYYGAADTTVCVATASVARLLDLVQRHPVDG